MNINQKLEVYHIQIIYSFNSVALIHEWHNFQTIYSFLTFLLTRTNTGSQYSLIISQIVCLKSNLWMKYLCTFQIKVKCSCSLPECETFSGHFFSSSVCLFLLVRFYAVKGILLEPTKRVRRKKVRSHCTVMRFLDLKEISTDMAADWIFEKFKLI